jgi:hypothetical protein
MMIHLLVAMNAFALTPKLLQDSANFQSGVRQTSIQQVSVKAPAGQIFIFARAEKEVLVECEFDPEYQPNIAKTRHAVSITIEPKNFETMRCAVGFPSDAELTVDLGSGQIETTGIKSTATLSLKSGTVKIKNTPWPEIRYQATIQAGTSTPVLDASKDQKYPLIQVKVDSGKILAL